MPDRFVPHFQEELQQLKTRLLEMGGLAEDRVRTIVQALVERNAALVDRVLGGDGPINQLHIEIDSRCFKLLALYQPMAVDLRAIVSAVKINTDLERVGDLADRAVEDFGEGGARVGEAADGDDRREHPRRGIVPFRRVASPLLPQVAGLCWVARHAKFQALFVLERFAT